MKDDLYNSATKLVLFPALARTASANGTGVDITACIGRLKIMVNTGAASGTTPTQVVKIQDSADNATFADLATPVTTASLTTTGDVELALDPRLCRRYIRAVTTIGGSTPSFTTAVLAVSFTQ